MPWTVNDVDKHNKGLSDHQKEIWVAVANSCLSKGDDDGTAIRKANGAVNKATLESVLYSKAAKYLEAVRLQETASLFEQVLNESDPKPRVEKDIKGQPVVPSEEQYREYFEGMKAVHIADQLQKAHDRWEEAAKKAEGSDNKFAKAEVEAIAKEMSVAKEVLQGKQESPDSIDTGTTPQVHGFIKGVAGELDQTSPLLSVLAQFLAKVVGEKS